MSRTAGPPMASFWPLDRGNPGTRLASRPVNPSHWRRAPVFISPPRPSVSRWITNDSVTRRKPPVSTRVQRVRFRVMTAPDPSRCPHCFAPLVGMPCPACGWRSGLDNSPPALALGRILDGRYRIGRVLGHGGFGITYLAWDDNLHLRLAIKEYFPRDSAGRGADGVSLAIYTGPAGEQFAYGLERFLEEARALAHFDQHPGIVTVKNFFRAHGTGYCVMDYVDGIPLRHYLDQQPGGRISVADALKLLMPVMDALRAVHKEGLLHRDLAPDNISLTADGRIKLLDFGAARFDASEHSKRLSIILKPGYAPE
ncbi:MAG: serine/threonine protein kinase, partial [Gammaproteobacteria bacterium]|nr:serine/threonine protein kinase [Gammaproteobacteria bacterium]